MNRYKHTQIHDNIVDEITTREAPFFPLRLFERYPAKEGGDSVIESEDGSLRVITCEFEYTTISVRTTKNRSPAKILSALQKFMGEVE